LNTFFQYRITESGIGLFRGISKKVIQLLFLAVFAVKTEFVSLPHYKQIHFNSNRHFRLKEIEVQLHHWSSTNESIIANSTSPTRTVSQALTFKKSD